MDVVYYSREIDKETNYIFGFNGINFKRTESESDNIDFVVFPAVRILVGLGNPQSEEDFKTELRNHPNYDFYKKNPHLPVIFFHRFEFIFDELYKLFVKIVCEEFNTKPQKIILLDSCVNPRQGVINPPKFIQFRQYHFKTYDIDNKRGKKFSFLTNKNNKLRTQIFDKVIYEYENDTDLLREENIVSFRNYLNTEKPPGPSSNISSIKNFIKKSPEYTFKNDFEFFKSLNLPWVIDDFKIGEGYLDMHDKMYGVYSQSYFSLMIDTQYFYSSLDFEGTDFNMAFSEKGLIPLHCGNLPFIIHYSDYYNRLEDVGFDFSYLKTLFDIDYKTNTLKQNFDSIEKFVSYFKNNTIDKISQDYESLNHIVKNNLEILKTVENLESNTYILEFYKQIKQEKNK
jgi:hypothetical protein